MHQQGSCRSLPAIPRLHRTKGLDVLKLSCTTPKNDSTHRYAG